VIDDVVPAALENMNRSQLEHDFVNSVASVAGAASTIIEYRSRLDGPTIESLAEVILAQSRRMQAVFRVMADLPRRSTSPATDGESLIDLRRSGAGTTE